MAGNDRECEVMIDQSRAIDGARFVKALGQLPSSIMREVSEKLRQVGDL
jgi:mRNA-degrading endonuclease toxin of MazEF toxin-antitoxin module